MFPDFIYKVEIWNVHPLVPPKRLLTEEIHLTGCGVTILNVSKIELGWLHCNRLLQRHAFPYKLDRRTATARGLPAMKGVPVS